jgi:hypothetical protein
MYRVQVYRWDEDHRPHPLNPQIVDAESKKAAAEMIIGGDLIEAGPQEKLAAKVWSAHSYHPDIASFYHR